MPFEHLIKQPLAWAEGINSDGLQEWNPSFSHCRSKFNLANLSIVLFISCNIHFYISGTTEDHFMCLPPGSRSVFTIPDLSHYSQKKIVDLLLFFPPISWAHQLERLRDFLFRYSGFLVPMLATRGSPIFNRFGLVLLRHPWNIITP